MNGTAADFGMSRYVHFASRLTGWNAIKSRAQQLQISMTDAQFKECTAKIKAMADVRPIAVDDADSIIRAFHRNIKLGVDHPLLHDMTAEEKAVFEQKEREMREEPEKRALDAQVAEEVETERVVKKAKTNGIST